MKVETATIAAKSVATGGAAVMMFGLTWWAVAIALVGAALSLHFEPEQLTVKVTRLVFGVLAVGFVAAVLAAALPHFPLIAWTADVPVEIRAGLLAVVVRPGYALGKRWAARRVEKTEP